MQTYVLI